MWSTRSGLLLCVLAAAPVVLPPQAAASEPKIWIPPVQDAVRAQPDAVMTDALARAVALHGPRGQTWHLQEPPADSSVRPLTIRIERTSWDGEPRYDLRIENGRAGAVDTAFVASDPHAGAATLAQALVVKCQFLLDQQSTGAADVAVTPMPRDPRLVLGLGTTVAIAVREETQGEYITMGPAIHARVLLARPIWLTIEGAAHVVGAGEVEIQGEDAVYSVRSYPISVLTGGMWSRRKLSWGVAGGLVYVPVSVEVDTGASQTEQVWGGAAQVHVDYQFIRQWHVSARAGLMYHSDERDVRAATAGNSFVLPNPQATLTLGVERRF